MKNIIFAILFVLLGTNAWALRSAKSLTATAVSESQINLSYIDRASRETGYIIERSLNQSSGFAEIARIGQNIVSYGDVGLTANTTYYYRVKGYRNRSRSRVVYSAYTNVASATTKGASTPQYTYSYVVGSWSACGANACGTSGIQTRTVTCKRNDGVSVSDSHCSGTKPATSQPCSAPACQYSYSWITGNYGSCSATACGTTGTQSRSVTCQRNDGVTVIDSYCSGTKPGTSKSCSAPACTYSSCTLPASLGGGTLAHNETIKAFQATNVAQGQSCISETRVCNDGSLSGSYLYSSCVVDSAPPQAGNGISIDLSYVDKSSSSYSKFKSMVDDVVNSGSRPYAFAGIDAAYMYRITGQAQYCTLAVKMAEEQVSAAESAINNGGKPEVSGDSYLEVGPDIQDVAIAYDWCKDQMNSVQRSRWANYANQAIYNVWNYNKATWGGRSYPWSGWSVDNPGNNYYYSFVNATMLWALASGNQYYLDFLKNDKFPALVSYYSQLAGGGSREGTGYGTAHMELFSVYQTWKDSTGQDLANASTHVTDTIRYWTHAIVPTRDRFAPIGDQSRDSSAMLFDYHRRLLLEARALSTNATDRALGSWALNNMSVESMRYAFNFRHDLIPAGTSSTLPNEALIHYGVGTGHLFARTSWEKNATWMSFVAGPYTESHAHQDQGAFSIYKNSWVAVTPNILSHSGINQETDIQNLVRFVKGSQTIAQVSHDDITSSNTSTFKFLTRNNATGEFTAEANLTSAYNGNSAIQLWKRNLAFVNNQNGQRVLNISDNFQVSSDTQAIFQVHTIAAPSVSGNVVTVGSTRITVTVPANPSISIVNMKSSEYDGGYRVEVRGPAGSGQFQVEIVP